MLQQGLVNNIQKRFRPGKPLKKMACRALMLSVIDKALGRSPHERRRK